MTRTHVRDGSHFYSRICFAGRQGAGKDTAGLFLATHGYHRYGFATPLYELLYKLNPRVQVEGHLNPITLKHAVRLYGWDSLKRGKSPETRKWLQNLGQGIRDTVGEDVFIREADNRLTGKPLTTICDVCHANEVMWNRRTGGVLVWIDNPRIGPGINPDHVSERGPIREMADIEIRNDGSVEDFHLALENRLIPETHWRKNG